MYEIPAADEIHEEACAALDAQDELAAWRDAFVLPTGTVYLDGMSLGALPKTAAVNVKRCVEHQWGQGLVRSWNAAGWIEAPQRLGAKIAPLIGAELDEVIVADSTSVNLFKLLDAAIRLRPDRNVILTETANFPTDIYVAKGVERLNPKVVLNVVAPKSLLETLNRKVAVVLLTHVDYKSGRMHDMTAINRRARECGALVLWDLSHSAGAAPLDLGGCDADLAVGCGYKYLNGGPGAPSYAYVARRHHGQIDQPINAWMGHARPFDFSLDYAPAKGITRLLSGTPPIVAMAAMEASLDIWNQVDLDLVSAKSAALSELFIRIVDRRLCAEALRLASPRNASQRGSHLAFQHPEAYAVMQALIDRNIIGDFREPDLMRFGFAPLYVSFSDVLLAATMLADLIDTGDWDQPRYRRRSKVT